MSRLNDDLDRLLKFRSPTPEETVNFDIPVSTEWINPQPSYPVALELRELVVHVMQGWYGDDLNRWKVDKTIQKRYDWPVAYIDKLLGDAVQDCTHVMLKTILSWHVPALRR